MLKQPKYLHLACDAPAITSPYQAYSPHTVMFLEERPKLHTSLLQFNIHIHFKLVDNILNPPENGQHNTVIMKITKFPASTLV